MSALLTGSSLKIVLALLAFQSGPQTIQRPLKVGDSDSYTMKIAMDQDMDMGAAGKQSIQSKMEYLYLLNITKLNDAAKTAEADMTLTTTKVEMGGMMANQQVPLPKPVHETGVVDSRNRFQPTKVDNALVSSFMNIGGGGAGQHTGLMIELPDHPVNVGDSWSMEVAGMAQMGAAGHGLTVTLLGPGQVNGHAVWKVKLTGHIPISADMNKMLAAAGSSSDQGQGAFTSMLANVTMTMDGFMDYSGAGTVDQSTGKTAGLDYTVTSDLTMHMTPKAGGAVPPMTIKVAGAMSCALKLTGY